MLTTCGAVGLLGVRAPACCKEKGRELKGVTMAAEGRFRRTLYEVTTFSCLGPLSGSGRLLQLTTPVSAEGKCQRCCGPYSVNPVPPRHHLVCVADQEWAGS